VSCMSQFVILGGKIGEYLDYKIFGSGCYNLGALADWECF
jgi:hypothetical protein